ncbi:PTS system D-mannitol-specific IIA component, Fru family [Natribacillus halophilus]|uniref:Mannitol-specific phosphotransferase enzyme IIA component n=2 Tax=Natribacillus halophilus TaxID=549003 RepID=A0A1G8PFK7_9BACI|nr:PTS sugar transporter subunit IIA [Natribacillus halophilus]SDI91075.1 PTS system D-mannitol-specific IIA component, Fru family [Natribacillus halophilus]
MILKPENIKLKKSVESSEGAIEEAGKILVEEGYVKKNYVNKMFEREEVTSTYMGNLLAIPHGTENSKDEVFESGLSILLLDQEIDWGGNPVQLVIGIAGKDDDHLEILSKIAIACSEEENIRALLRSNSEEEVLNFFSEVNT